MKTAKEKANELAEQVVGLDLRTSVGVEKLIDVIRLALKEQDRDTRHACAEAVLGCDKSLYNIDLIWKDDAHSACMNVKAV